MAPRADVLLILKTHETLTDADTNIPIVDNLLSLVTLGTLHKVSPVVGNASVVQNHSWPKGKHVCANEKCGAKVRVEPRRITGGWSILNTMDEHT